MTYIAYIEKNFSGGSQAIIAHASEIIAEYERQGFTLTLRQLYYQFVARNLLANKQTEYKRLGSIINDARLAGLISWTSVEDRTRQVRKNPHWEKPRDILESARDSYANDKWDGQSYRPEVWIEKDALLGVIEPVCKRLDVPYFSCRGYTSQSEQWRAGQRQKRAIENGQSPIIFHLGDHDPSGLDMTWDNWKRLNLFCGFDWQDVTEHYDKGDAFQNTNFNNLDVTVRRLALNKDQIEEHNPPPNPAKLTDSRVGSYVRLHGMNSWELDALDPVTLSGIIEDAVLAVRDEDLWKEAVAHEEEGRDRLSGFIDQLDDDDTA